MNTNGNHHTFSRYNFEVRIFFISSGLKPEYGGAAISEASLVASIRDEVDVVLGCPNSRLDPNFALRLAGIRAFAFQPVETIFAYVFRMGRLFREVSSSDLVHINGHWRWENFFISALCRSRGIPYLVHPRGMLWLGHRKKLMKKVFNWLLGYTLVRKAAAVVALSVFETKQWIPYHLSDRQIQVIPNGFTPLGAQLKAGADQSIGFFLFVGRIESRKNLEFLLRAFSDYRGEGGKFQLQLMGPEERGYGDQIRSLARDLGIAQEVLFIPPIYGEDKWVKIAAARAVLYPSIEEAFGRVPFEAALSGTVSVAPVESGSFEYLERFFAPYFFPLSDRDALTRILHGLERFPPDPERILQAKRFVEISLAWKVVSAKFLKLYQGLRQMPNVALRKAS